MTTPTPDRGESQYDCGSPGSFGCGVDHSKRFSPNQIRSSRMDRRGSVRAAAERSAPAIHHIQSPSLLIPSAVGRTWRDVGAVSPSGAGLAAAESLPHCYPRVENHGILPKLARRRSVRDRGVGDSNPLAPTKDLNRTGPQLTVMVGWVPFLLALLILGSLQTLKTLAKFVRDGQRLAGVFGRFGP